MGHGFNFSTNKFVAAMWIPVGRKQGLPRYTVTLVDRLVSQQAGMIYMAALLFGLLGGRGAATARGSALVLQHERQSHTAPPRYDEP